MATGSAERQGVIHPGLGEADGRTAAKAASGAGPALRLHYVDWLRALAVLTVVGYHASLPFGNVLGPWPVQNAQMSEALGRVNAVLAFFFTVFFLLAGASARLALRNRSVRSFLSERAARLALPFLAGIVLLVLPTQYWLAVYTGATHDSFLTFVPAWASARLDLVLGWGFSPMVFAIGEWLWFLGWLFVFALLASPIFALLSTSGGRAVVDAMARMARWPGASVLFSVPITLVSLPLFRITPADQWQGWWAFGVYFPIFVIGYVIYCDERLVAAVKRDLIPALVASGLALYGIAATGFTASIFAGGAHTSDLYYVFIVFLHALMGWAPALLVLSFGMWIPGFQRPLHRTLGEAALPTYILHMPIVLVISSFAISWSMSLWPKAAVNVLLGLLVSFGAAWAAVRIPGVRTVLGVRRSDRRTSITSAAAPTAGVWSRPGHA